MSRPKAPAARRVPARSSQAAAAPSPYGTVQAPAPARQTAGVQCRTEYTTVWDTEYVERETQECVTKYVPECKTVFERQCQPTTRQVVS